LLQRLVLRDGDRAPMAELYSGPQKLDSRVS
jgi:hypothetical protein